MIAIIIIIIILSIFKQKIIIFLIIKRLFIHSFILIANLFRALILINKLLIIIKQIISLIQSKYYHFRRTLSLLILHTLQRTRSFHSTIRTLPRPRRPLNLLLFIIIIVIFNIPPWKFEFDN